MNEQDIEQVIRSEWKWATIPGFLTRLKLLHSLLLIHIHGTISETK